MSRPIIQVRSASYNSTSDIITLDLLALRLRGQSSITLGGLTSSQNINLGNGYYNGTFTFSAVLDTSTSSLGPNAVYVPAVATMSFGGTASPNSSLILSINAQQILSYTFSATQSLSTALDTLVATMSFTGAASGFSAGVAGSNIKFTAPEATGPYYNGFSVNLVSGNATGTFTFSRGASFSGGNVTAPFDLGTSNFGTLGGFGITVY